MTGDRVEAAAKELPFASEVSLGYAALVLDAADEADRVAGVVRARADVLAEIREYADEWAAQPNLYSPAHASTAGGPACRAGPRCARCCWGGPTRGDTR